MSTVKRIVFLNTLEPAPLSFRTPMGIETRVEATFLNQNGQPYNTDMAAQLQLTARSSNANTSYSMPYIDIVNGKARAVIPAGDLSDPNGYRLRLFGTVNGEPMLVAMGTVTPISFAGPMATPEDVIDTIDLSFERGFAASVDVKLWYDTGKTTPYDIASVVITAPIQSKRGGVQIETFTVNQIAYNEVRLSLDAIQTNDLPDTSWWQLQAATAAGTTTLAQGVVTATGVYVPPLGPLTAPFDYLKPDSGDPIAGQVIQPNLTMDTLRVSTTDHNGASIRPTLEILRIGDQVAAGGLTWTIKFASNDNGNFFELFIDPPDQQLPATGVVDFNFSRPPP